MSGTQTPESPRSRVYCYFSVFEPLFARVADVLDADHGIDIFGGFVWGLDQRDHLIRTGRRWTRLDVFSQWLDELPDTVEPGRLEALEERYGVPNLALIVTADRFISQWPYERIVRVLSLCFRKAEQMIDEERPDAIIFESIDGVVTLALHLVARSRSIPSYVLDAGRVVGRAAIHGDYRQRWDEVDDAFDRLRAAPLPEDRREEAQRFIDEFRARRQQPPYLGTRPSVRLRDLGRFVGAARRYLRDPRNITLTAPATMIRSRVVRLVRHAISHYAGYFEDPVASEPYVLFPLHFQPETTTLVCAPLYVDQLALIDDIAKSLPAGVRLYVKEHSSSIGRRALGDYKRIKRVWNARLISPRASTFALIDRAKAVITITSTMGWEAILLDRPVICFGEVFYKSFPLVVRGGEVPKRDWPDMVAKTLAEWAPDRELLLRFVAAVLEGTVASPVVFDNPYTRPAVLHDANVREVARLFARAIDRGRT